MDFPLEQSWARVRSRQGLGEDISRSNGDIYTFQSTTSFICTFHVHIHLWKSMVAWSWDPSLYFYEIGDGLVIGQDCKRGINNAFLQTEKYVFPVARTVEEWEANWKTTKTHTVRSVSSRVTVTPYVGLVVHTYSTTVKVRWFQFSQLPSSLTSFMVSVCSGARFFVRQGGDAFAFFVNTWKREHKHKAFERQLL